MNLFQQFLRHPQQLWLRRLNLQVHLWTGIVLAVYLTVVGITGSILVFGSELSRLLDPNPWLAFQHYTETADLSVVISALRSSYPHTHVVSVTPPTPQDPVFKAVLQTRGRITVVCHPLTGQLIGEAPHQASRLEWIYDLHENLLSGRKGRVVNGSGAAALILLVLTGIVNWWPGLLSWRRALKIDFRRRWRRVNFDLHSAVGFWSVGFLAIWALSGIYFTWPDKLFSIVDHVSPVINSRPPAVTVDPNTEMRKLDYHAMIMKARALDPGAQWKGLIFPSSRRSPFEMLMSRSLGVGRDYEDTLYFSPYTGDYISTWQYGVNKSIGDWIIWLQIPIHFGTHWGFAVKCLWAGAGLALPLLAVTGLIMYWNRVLSKRWSRMLAVQ